MKVFLKYIICLLFVGTGWLTLSAQKASYYSQLRKDFVHPPGSAKPWVFWYWVNGNVSKEGIKADLESMKEVGLGGAYLMFIKDTVHSSAYPSAVSQLSKDWFQLVAFAIQESKRLHLELGFHISDGFALAGGPWIEPAQSMQKLVWTKKVVNGLTNFQDSLPQPEKLENYYEDIAVYAYPNKNNTQTSGQLKPVVSTSNSVNADFLIKPNSKESFKSDSAVWIQYTFDKPFTCRTIRIRTNGNNYQAQRLIIQSSMDGIHFNNITRLASPRHGWQDTDADITHSIPATTAKYFRFVYDKSGTEPGAEDLDNAKWKPSLKVAGIDLLTEATIHQYESKNGSVWRISNTTTRAQVSDTDCIPVDQLINISAYYKAGKLTWKVPAGSWTILRIGHTSTGHKNETAGGGKGLECDKFDAAAVDKQFNHWFNKIYQSVDAATAKEVIKILHVDSWECGSQNWSANFAIEFKKRRGYDLLNYLPVMAGLPIQSIEKSEAVLHDVRTTIAELVADVFYSEVKKLAAEKNCLLSAESVAPTMVSDGLLHYKYADLPMGEFWNNSPTHDKPNDMLDAISAAHIYGKNMVQAESFTTLRMNWNEHPGNLKTIGDRNFALGINKMVIHVFTQNPWIEKQPGVTLDPIGLYYQRNQTWFKQSKVWIDYLSRCQLLLQQGKPQAALAVFTGEELPSRSVLPDRLVDALPGIFGVEKVAAEKKRLLNELLPMRQIPAGISHSANMADPENWVNPLNGYSYDSFNPDVLMQMHAEKGSVYTKDGASYKLLLLIGNSKMNPNNTISDASVRKLIQLVKAGATLLIDSVYTKSFEKNGAQLLFKKEALLSYAKMGLGKIVLTPYQPATFKILLVDQDVEILNKEIDPRTIAFTHRKTNDTEIYFLSNQTNNPISIHASFAVSGMRPEIWDANTALCYPVNAERSQNSKTAVWVPLAANASVFVLFRNSNQTQIETSSVKKEAITIQHLNSNWTVQFNEKLGGPAAPIPFNVLSDWTQSIDTGIKYYSGTVLYKNSFEINDTANLQIAFENIKNIASIKINGIDCGTIWTPPFVLPISKALRLGKNIIEIAVTNTWNNRLVLDSQLPFEKRISYTVYPFDWSKKPLQSAGLIGDISIQKMN